MLLKWLRAHVKHKQNKHITRLEEAQQVHEYMKKDNMQTVHYSQSMTQQ